MDSIIIFSEETIKPSSPTPAENSIHKLSEIDLLAPNVHISLVFFYLRSNATETTLSHLKASLSETLSLYYPLAGRLREDLHLSCNDEGALLLQAKVASSLCTLLQKPNAAEVDKLLPCQQHCSGDSREGMVLAIQLNLFSCGGIAIGVCVSHRIADGLSLVVFMKTWADISLGPQKPVSPPTFDASSIFPPRAKPEFPHVDQDAGSGSLDSPTLTKIFSLEGSKILTLRDASELTKVGAVSALLWRCIIRARREQEEASSRAYVATHVVNLRKRMNPPLRESQFGNLWSVTATLGFIPEENKDKIFTLTNNQMAESMKSISVKLSDVFKISEELFTRFSGCGVELCCFSSFRGFPVYEVDFGWGNPAWVARGSLHYKNSVTLMPSRETREEEEEEDPGMEAWVSMDPEEMRSFEKDPELISILSSDPEDHSPEIMESPLLAQPSSWDSSLSPPELLPAFSPLSSHPSKLEHGESHLSPDHPVLPSTA